MLNLVPTACQWSAKRLFAPQATVRGIRSSCYCKPMAHSKSVDNSVAAAAPQQNVASSPPRKRRVEWQWECPACSNKHSTGPRLLHHMAKCCDDLLPSKYSLFHISTLVAQEQQCPDADQDEQPPQQLQQQQQAHGSQTQVQQAEGLHLHWRVPADSSNSHRQQQPATPAADNAVEDLQAVLAAAIEQEHNLRMWALRLRFIDDSKQQSAAAAEDVEDNEPSGQSAPLGTQPVGTPVLGQPVSADSQQQVNAVTAAVAAATPGASTSADCDAQSGANGRAGSGNSSSQLAAKRRGRARSYGRTPVRSIEQLMQEMKLPKARVLRLLERAPRSIKLVADKEPLQVVYEDAHFLAVSKPPGLRSAPVHRFQGGSAVNRMIGYLGAEPYLLHRIDMDTSGVLLAAKDATTASLINAQFQSKQVSKAYLALCLGVPEQQTFTVEGQIAQHPTVNVARMLAADGLPSVTHVQVLSVSTTCPQDASSRWGPAAAADPATRVRGVGCCLVCCRPVTGRTHQIRVHMAHAGHPLLADDVYGLQGPWMDRQALHAVSLTLQNPHSGEPLTFVAPPPDDFAAAAAGLGLSIPQPHQLAALSFSTKNTSL